jgi:hypothetical protein
MYEARASLQGKQVGAKLEAIRLVQTAIRQDITPACRGSINAFVPNGR